MDYFNYSSDDFVKSIIMKEIDDPNTKFPVIVVFWDTDNNPYKDRRVLIETREEWNKVKFFLENLKD